MGCAALLKAINAYIEKADKNLESSLKSEGYVEAKKTVLAITALEDNVSAALREQSKNFTDYLKTQDTLETAVDNIEDFTAKDSIDKTVCEVVETQLTTCVPEFTESYIKTMDKGLALNGMSKRATSWISSWSEQLGQLMKLNTHTELENILQKGAETGSSIDNLITDILNSGIRNEEYKARRVAVTEGLRAHSYAQLEGMRQVPGCVGKEWSHTGGGVTSRQNHVDMDGNRVKLNEKFILISDDGGGMYECDCPRDTNLPAAEVINCHCMLKKVMDKDIMGLSLEERQKLQQEAIAADNAEWEKELDAKNRRKAEIEPEYKRDVLSYDAKGIPEAISQEKVLKELEKNEIGRDVLSYIEENRTTVHFTSAKANSKTTTGDSIPSMNYITVYANNLKDLTEAAKTIIHEVTHVKYNIGGNQWAEAQCFSAELLFEKGELTISDKRDIIKNVKKNYSNMSWR